MNESKKQWRRRDDLVSWQSVHRSHLCNQIRHRISTSSHPSETHKGKVYFEVQYIFNNMFDISSNSDSSAHFNYSKQSESSKIEEIWSHDARVIASHNAIASATRAFLANNLEVKPVTNVPFLSLPTIPLHPRPEFTSKWASALNLITSPRGEHHLQDDLPQGVSGSY